MDVHWTHGSQKPQIPAEVTKVLDKKLPSQGSVIVGTEGVMIGDVVAIGSVGTVTAVEAAGIEMAGTEVAETEDVDVETVVTVIAHEVVATIGARVGTSPRA